MNKNAFIRTLAAVIAALAMVGCASDQRAQAQLLAQAKISREQAQRIALAEAPGGVIKDAGLETDNGGLIWSFDIVTPGSNNLTEVNVDAINGSLVSVITETPAQEAQEKQ